MINDLIDISYIVSGKADVEMWMTDCTAVHGDWAMAGSCPSALSAPSCHPSPAAHSNTRLHAGIIVVYLALILLVFCYFGTGLDNVITLCYYYAAIRML